MNESVTIYNNWLLHIYVAKSFYKKRTLKFEIWKILFLGQSGGHQISNGLKLD